MFSKLLSNVNWVPKHKPKKNEESDIPSIRNDQPSNPFNEISILSGHQDLINIIKVIDGTRLASSADDNLVIIWDFENGDLIHRLLGHTKPVTSMLVHRVGSRYQHLETSPLLITASLDTSIRIWDVNDGTCVNILDSHASSVKCLVHLNGKDSIFFSGGEYLCLWNIDGKLLCQEMQLHSDSDIRIILPIKNDKVVISFNTPSLVVYTVSQVLLAKYFKFNCQLRPHSDDVRCLSTVTEECFVSASLDGEIILWSSHSLQPIQKFNECNKLEEEIHLYPYSIQHLFVVDQRFIFAAVGEGFAIYDVLSGKCVAQREKIHHSKVSYIHLLKERYFLATCSEDGTVRLWGSTAERLPSNDYSPIERFLGKSLNDITSTVSQPELLGECRGHSGSVRMLADFGADGFASCADGMIILWKDGWREREKRLELASSLLFS